MAKFEQEKVVTLTVDMETRPLVGTVWEYRRDGGWDSHWMERYNKADIIQGVIDTMGDAPIDGLAMEQMTKHIARCTADGYYGLGKALQEGLDKYLEGKT